jgi:hypothetical protein
MVTGGSVEEWELNRGLCQGVGGGEVSRLYIWVYGIIPGREDDEKTTRRRTTAG